MEPEPVLRLDVTHRLGFVLEAALIRRLIPVGVIGVYLLTNGPDARYVGRSDTCLQTRLCQHALARRATHVVYEVCRTAEDAYLLEAYWFHRLRDLSIGFNAIHPARPVGRQKGCPFCQPKDAEALCRALEPGTGNPVISSIAPSNGVIQIAN